MPSAGDDVVFNVTLAQVGILVPAAYFHRPEGTVCFAKHTDMPAENVE